MSLIALLHNHRTMFLAGLVIGLALGLSAGFLPPAESTRTEDKAEQPLCGGQPTSFWIWQLKDRDPTLRQQAMRALVQLGPKQPGAIQALTEMLQDNKAPLPMHGAFRQTEHIRDLFHAHPGEVAQLHSPRVTRVELLQLIQCFVQVLAQR
jgi:hypothetical protein